MRWCNENIANGTQTQSKINSSSFIINLGSTIT